tara:strand:- start:6187 stop:6405 length:219 start_codon:yes stop_codon:yes gene_type:complete
LIGGIFLGCGGKGFFYTICFEIAEIPPELPKTRPTQGCFRGEMACSVAFFGDFGKVPKTRPPKYKTAEITPD